MQLRDYQQRTIDQLYAWFEAGNVGNPCLVLPTGAGKSHIIAALCKDSITQWPDTKVLMLTHVRELIEQNADKMREHWPDALLGIYSASIGRKDLGEPITFAGIQSVRDKAKELGHVDLIIIDECHLVNHKNEGSYRKLLGALKAINPEIRVIGLTATPYRLGHGLITDKPALFDDLIEPVSIEELIFKGYLSTLRSKVTKAKLDTSGVKKRGGEFIESELQAAVDTDDNNRNVVREIFGLAGDRKAWLFFCTGVKHAQHIAEVLNQQGVKTECVLGETPKKERERIIAEFKAGQIRALTNANVLTTGFDYPDIDLIAMLRPTMSPGLYVQMAGRGMRVKSHTDHCLVLDFAGVVGTHGPITNVQPPKKGGDGNGEAPVKVCYNCAELCHPSTAVCPSCDTPFPEPVKKKLSLHNDDIMLSLRNDDIMGTRNNRMDVTRWDWRSHTSRASGKIMLSCTYYGTLYDQPITEYFPIYHEGYAGQKSMRQFVQISRQAAANIEVLSPGDTCPTIDMLAVRMNNSHEPDSILYSQDGKFFRVSKRLWQGKSI